MIKKLLISAFVAFICLATPILADSQLDPADFETVGENFTVVAVYGESAKKMADKCDCGTYVDVKAKLIFLLIVRPDKRT